MVDRLRRWIGVFLVIGASLLVLLAMRIVFWPADDDITATQTAQPIGGPLSIAAVDYVTPLPTIAPRQVQNTVDWIRPTADPSVIQAALDMPVVESLEIGAVSRNVNPLTIIPARSRSTVITYTVKKGDTLKNIAEKFGITQSTIIWSNDRFYVNAMRVGMEMNILPVNGVYHHLTEPQMIRAIAEEYEVDPYAIIDSEYNTLFGATPDTILPSGLNIVVPDGKGSTKPIYWDPGIVITNTADVVTDGSKPIGAGVKVGQEASFAIGDPGSCGKQAVMGGTAPVGLPIYARYTFSQDFSWVHGGVDLAVPPGTPVFAAGGGTVIFAGISTWGYGYTVVLAHGSTISVYGHLNGAFVGCGQIITPGQNIAVTGNSGRSSGPHLHFEIRGPSGSPINPWEFMSFSK